MVAAACKIYGTHFSQQFRVNLWRLHNREEVGVHLRSARSSAASCQLGRPLKQYQCTKHRKVGPGRGPICPVLPSPIPPLSILH